MTEYVARAIDMLKASGWQTGCISVAAAIFLILTSLEVLPPMPTLLVVAVWVVLFLCAALTVAALGPLLESSLKAIAADRKRRRLERELETRFRQHLPYLTEDERNVLGYLLKRKTKVFTADHDAGNAATLLAQGFIQYIGAPGQSFDFDKCPFQVPAPVWKVMEEEPDKFIYTPDVSGGVEAQPWRINWMLR